MLSRIALISCLLAPLMAQTAEVRSPDGQISVALTVPASGPNAGWLTYEVKMQGRPVVAPSRLGLDLQSQPVLGDKVRIVAARNGAMDETYSMKHGKSNPLRNVCHTLEVMIEEPEGLRRKMTVDVRAFNDGVGFRYRIPAQPPIRELVVEKEMTQFTFAAEGPAWPLVLANYRTSYEDSYVKLPLTSIKQDSLVALPFLTQVPGGAWVGVTEAHLENWAGLYLMRSAGRTMEARLAPRAEEPNVLVRLQTPAQSPWRVLLLGTEPGRLVESNIVLHLSPPSRIADESWIRPGKTSWSWWSGDLAKNVSFQPGMNTETMKHYIDFSAANGLEYMLVDEGWSAEVGGRSRDLTKTNPKLDMPAIMDYARQKGVGIWLWAYWTFVDSQMDEAFPLFEKWGVKGVKIDFMDRDDQTMVEFYHRCAKKAAEHKLMIDYHGAYKPTGLRRYYPNVITHEGVMGLEYLKWSARVTAEHNTVVPFTRMLAGPLDYTPGGMNNVKPDTFQPRWSDPLVPTTRAHQLGLFVVFENGFQMLADCPENYQGQPELEFLKTVPVAWDETRVLAGEPGEFIVIARRRGKDWYVGAITNGYAREVQIPLSFLTSGRFRLQSYQDDTAGGDPRKTVRTEADTSSGARVTVRLAPAGGAALVLRPAS
jgi:alpha-glucosidase